MPRATCPLDDHGFGAVPRQAPVSSTWYTRGADYPRALEEQQASGRPMVLYVFTDWCPYCREFQKELLSTAEVDSYLRDHAVKVRVNPEAGPEEAALARAVGATGYPSFFVSTPGQRPVKVSLYRDRRLISPGELVGLVESHVSGWASAVVAGATAGGSRTSLERERLAQQLTQVIAWRPQEVWGYLARARVLAEDRQLDAALDDLARVDQDRPGLIEVYQATEDVLGPDGRWDEVIACWSRLLQRPAGRRPEVYLARSRALHRRSLDQLARADEARACEMGARQACSAVASGN